MQHHFDFGIFRKRSHGPHGPRGLHGELQSLWGNKSLTGFPLRDTPHFSGKTGKTYIVVNTVELSYKWRRSRASGDNTLLPHFPIGIEDGR